MEGYNKMKVITVTNQKGGTGKTSTTLFMAYGIAKQGKKVLVIDLDQQADSSFSFHVPYEDSQSTFQLLTGTATVSYTHLHQIFHSLIYC